MSIEMKAAADEWERLRKGSHEASGLEIPTLPAGVLAPAGPVRLALGQQGEPRLLLPLMGRDRVPKLPPTPSLRIGDVVYQHSGQSLRFLDVTCVVGDLEGVFAEVADEILSRIANGQDCVRATQSTLEDFRALLIATPVGEKPAGTVCGIVGELLVLNRLLDRTPVAWRAWCGPVGDRHDFRAGASSLEVKSSMDTTEQLVSIHGIDQLLPPVNGTLHLVHLVLEKVPGGMLSVSALARAAMEKADDPGEVRSRLVAIDCANPDAPEWNSISFRLAGERMFHVIEGFPRLVEHDLVRGSLQMGVASIEYQVDLSAARQFLVDADGIPEVEDRILACL